MSKKWEPIKDDGKSPLSNLKKSLELMKSFLIKERLEPIQKLLKEMPDHVNFVAERYAANEQSKADYLKSLKNKEDILNGREKKK